MRILHTDLLLISIICIITVGVVSCGGFKDYPAVPIEQVDFLKRAETKTENGLSVTISVLTAEESRQIFGVDLFKKGVQPVWVEIRNETDHDLLFLPVSLDPDYFAPNEVAFLYQGLFNGGQVHPQLSQRFNDYGYELSRIEPGQVNKGFVYTNFDPGIKYVNITLFSDESIETFVFYLLLFEAEEEYELVDFDNIYSEDVFLNYDDEDSLRQAVLDLPCCIQSDENNEDEYPLNFVFIGDDEDVFGALVRRGWYVTEPYSELWAEMNRKQYFSSPLFGTTPMQNLYFFGRHQDVSLQKTRKKDKSTVRQRNEIRIWLAPITYRGKNVWVGTTTRDIGTDVTKIKDFFTKKIDPDLDETRSYLVEDMVLSQSVSRLGWVRAAEPVREDEPNINSSGQPWWSDGLILVLLLEEPSNSASDISFFDWDSPRTLDSESKISPSRMKIENE